MIFKALVYVDRIVRIEHPSYPYNEEQTAYAPYQYFGTLELAQAHAAQYSTKELIWEEVSSDAYFAEGEDFKCIVYVEKDSEYNTNSKPALPDNFSGPSEKGD